MVAVLDLRVELGFGIRERIDCRKPFGKPRLTDLGEISSARDKHVHSFPKALCHMQCVFGAQRDAKWIGSYHAPCGKAISVHLGRIPSA